MILLQYNHVFNSWVPGCKIIINLSTGYPACLKGLRIVSGAASTDVKHRERTRNETSKGITTHVGVHTWCRSTLAILRRDTLMLR